MMMRKTALFTINSMRILRRAYLIRPGCRFLACPIIVLFACLTADADERPLTPGTSGTDEFPEFNLPKLSGDGPSDNRPLPGADDGIGKGKRL
jgi:hypothetical protein